MTLRALTKCALLALHVLGTIASPVGISATDELVQTPGGFIPKSNVHLIPDGGAVVHTPTAVQLIDADGTVLHTRPLTGSTTSILPHRNVSGTPTSNAPRALQSGYVAYAYWSPPSGSNISSFQTNWTVPPVPANWAGQTVYIFNALVPSSYDAILQPVLQYGYSPAGGSAYWGIASWYILGSDAYYTTLIEVESGQVLTGVISTSQSPTSAPTSPGVWYAYFLVNNVLNRSTRLSASTAEALNTAYEALEIYGISTAADLPTGKTPMSGIQFNMGASKPSAINWVLNSDPTDSISIQLVSSSSSNGELQILYPTS